ncbi:hypothetical protein [Derxia lacustris]|uniref:hypothetical protein n=1 Tax=Derxia lacustris TaxID=764842 RepID=UPI000A170215|nr:hypothetical protein [Derxia lacustris]
MNLKPLAHLSIALALGLGAVAARASGSDAGGGAETGDAQAYNLGKSVYASKVACASCPLPGKSLDEATARELLAGKHLPTLADDEANALGVYLKRRFKL